jgi:hypothetical protein
MDVLHCQTVLGVHKELRVFAILYNLVRLVILQSAKQQQVGVERISFLDALRGLGAPATGVLLEALFVNPTRPHRVEPRVKKRRPKAFPCMTKSRRALRQALLQHRLGDELNAIRLRPDDNGYLLWKGQTIERLEPDFARTDAAKGKARILAARCGHLEGIGEPVNKKTVVLTWGEKVKQVAGEGRQRSL